MRLSVRCITCHEELGAAEAVGGITADLLLLLGHVTLPHNNSHELRLLVDGRDLAAMTGTRHLRIRCLSPACEGKHEVVRDVPDWLVTAFVIGFHARHEAHPFALEIDGVAYWPST